LNLKVFYSKNRIPICLIFLSIFVFGIISLFYLDYDLIPDIEYPELTVITSYPNATPEEVKNLVSIPIEQIVLSLKGVKNVNTLSREGISIVRIQYQWGENLSISHIELREKMDLLKSFFPKEVKRPVIINYQPSQDAVAGISVSSDTLDERSLYLLCRKDVKAVLEKTEGISHVHIAGGRKPEVKLMVDPEKLVKYNISIAEIRNIIKLSNKNFPVGFFDDDKYEYLVRVNSEVTDYRELEDIILREEDKKLVFVKDVATVEYGTEEKDTGVLIDGKNALMFSIYKQPASNIMKVSRRIDEQISLLNERYKGNISFYKVFDESIYIKDSLRNLIIAMILGIFFTIFSVYIFLYNFKISFIIILTIPLSIIGTFIIMKMTGLSINLLTLGGFSLAIGMIVDNSVIVVTSVHELLYSRTNEGRFYARLKKIIPAVFSATFTTIVVFFPILFLSGILKLIFLQLSLMIVVSLIFSLVIAVTLIPVLLQRVRIEKRDTAFFQLVWRIIETFYQKALFAVFKKKIFFVLALFIIFVFGLISYRSIDKQFIESLPQDYFYVNIFIKQQATFEYTARFTDYVSDMIKKDGRVSKIIGTIGVDKNDVTANLDGIYGTNTAILKIYTEEKGESFYALISSIRKGLGIFRGVDFFITIPDNPVQRMISRSNFDAVIKVFDPSPEYLAGKVKEITSFVKTIEAKDITGSYYMSNTEWSLLIKRNEMSIYKVEAPFVGEFIATALSGLRVGTWKKDEHEIPILLHFKKDSFSDINDLLGFSIKNREGKDIKLNEVLYVTENSSPNIILRENQKNYAKVEFNLKKGKNRNFSPFAIRDEKRKIKSFISSSGIDFEYTDQFTLLRENYLELLLALFLAVLLEYVILASGFKSFTKPALVLLMIPLSIPGIFLILSLLNSSLNINTFMSLIVLIGLMVNNAIMLFLEYRDGKVKNEKDIASASVRRLKPILITTISTILALLPTLFTMNKIQITLAATLISGLLYSTLITLLYLPLFYSFFYIKRSGDEKKPV